MLLRWLKEKSVQAQRANIERSLEVLIDLAEKAEREIQRTGEPLQGLAAQRITKAQQSLLGDLVGPIPLAELREDYLQPIVNNNSLSESSEMAVRHVFDTASPNRLSEEEGDSEDDVLLHARVQIAQSGHYDVQLQGDTTERNLTLLALVYGAKIRWLLNQEPEELVEIFTGGVSQCMNLVGQHDDNDLLTALGAKKALAASRGGETYDAQLKQHAHLGTEVTNSLAQPSLPGNIVMHYFVLLAAIEAELSREGNNELGIALGTASMQWEMENGPEANALRRMMLQSNRSYGPRSP